MTSVNLTRQVSDEHSDEALFWLMEIDAPEIGEVLYVCNNNEELTSRGRTYTPYPFEVVLPPDNGGKPAAMKLVTYNLDPRFIDLVRQTTEPPSVKIELVSSRDMDTPEKVVDFMVLSGAEYDALTITFTLASSNWHSRKTLQATYQQAEFPGLFFALQ